MGGCVTTASVGSRAECVRDNYRKGAGIVTIRPYGWSHAAFSLLRGDVLRCLSIRRIGKTSVRAVGARIRSVGSASDLLQEVPLSTRVLQTRRAILAI
jgi:hypothetical protein